MSTSHEEVSCVDNSRNVAAIQKLLREPAGHLHFIGIGGVGMAGLAFLLSREGFRISGCDLVESRITDWLRRNQISVCNEHNPEHMEERVLWAVRTSAVKADAPEVLRAKQLNIPVYLRGAVLAALIDKRRTIAVTGTHGKTTTATFISQLLGGCGLAPDFCIGAEIDDAGTVAGQGTSDLLVVEADESDGTVALYHPETAVLTNIEYDHMEHFKNKEDMEECFRHFARAARKQIIYCKDDSAFLRVLDGLSNTVSYGFSDAADVRGIIQSMNADSADVLLQIDGEDKGMLHLPVTGKHNVLNALAAVTVAYVYDCSFEEIQKAVIRLSLSRRRFERVCEGRGITVISDYAHHPTEIRAVIAMARLQPHSRILAIFQPHRYTRTLALGPQFVPAFEGVDHLVLAPVYPASEAPIEGGTAEDLHASFLSGKFSGVCLADSLKGAWEISRVQLSPGDILLLIGAGDVEIIGEWASVYLSETES